jgi:putative membrane-bound dehydrogenase-like protein
MLLRFGTGLHAEETAAPYDYSQELPRIPVVEPANAIATFQLQPGFRLEQVAAEPLLASPVAVAWDEAGRMFVVEMCGYSEDRDQRLGRIRCLTDTNDDGVYDHAEIFADQLLWPTAIACWDGGILVADAPDLWFIKDLDADLHADAKEVVLTGFGTGNVQGLVNSLEWHFDQRIYGASSSNHGLLHSARDPHRTPVDLRGRDFSFDPTTMEIRGECGGAQHGASFDDWGNRFVCSNSDHLQQVLFEERYLLRNPRLAVAATRASIASDGPQANVFRISPIEPWRIVRTRLRVAGMVPGPVEGGGRAAGYFTGATGSTVIRGSAFPAEFHQQVVVGDAGGNIVHRKKLQRIGTQFRGDRIDHESEFLASTDIWFRPVQFANGPDGGLYVIDMCREVIEHPDSLPPVIKLHLDLTSGRDRGRIYRIVPEDYIRPRTPNLGKMTTAELLPFLDHPNLWHRGTASRLLRERDDLSVADALEKFIVAPGTTPLGKIWGLYALHSLRPSASPVLTNALKSPHPEVRRHAVRLTEGYLDKDPNLIPLLLSMVDDQAIEVRFQLASTLGYIPVDQRVPAIAKLLVQSSIDPHLVTACLSSLSEGADTVFLLLLDNRPWRSLPESAEVLVQLLPLFESPWTVEQIAPVLTRIAQLPPQEDRLVAQLTCQISERVQGRLPSDPGGDLMSKLASLQHRSYTWGKKVVDDVTSPDSEVAMATYRFGPSDELKQLARRILGASSTGSMKLSLLTMMREEPRVELATEVLDALPVLTPEERRSALGLILSLPEWTGMLLDRLEQGEIRSSQLDPVSLNALKNHPDRGLRARAEHQISTSPSPDKQELLKGYQGVAKLDGDAARGKEIFTRVCSGCHQIGDVGKPLGPSLPAMVQRGLDAILLGVLDPNREVNPQHENFILTTVDGRILSGMLTAESSNSISLQAADGLTTTVSRNEIEEFQGTGKSFMPEGLEQQVDPTAMADLWAYLQTLH